MAHVAWCGYWDEEGQLSTQPAHPLTSRQEIQAIWSLPDLYSVSVIVFLMSSPV